MCENGSVGKQREVGWSLNGKDLEGLVKGP